ncbi:MAG: J domain-containing protein, partial [Desulfosalsimonadaceae bacterium]|nr:J domain-containing protein [Desulfosalsimonadaceae bacterium]
LLPGFSPIGLLDDAFLTGLLVYYLKTGRMPAFVSWLGRFIFGEKISGNKESKQGASQAGESANHGENRGTETGRPHSKDPFEILGIAPGASKQEIQTAYRKIVQQYHPDKVAHLGRELQDLAKDKFVEIQNAYDYLMNH